VVSVRAARFVVRMVNGAADIVHDRAPWLSERAYRAVTVPLMMADPVGGARSVQARLDTTRERVATMAVTGRARRGDVRAVRRDLARVGQDVERLTPLLSAVQARGLRMRSAAYAQTLGVLVDGSPVPGALPPLWKAAFLVGGAAVWIGVLAHLSGPIIATLFGLVAGVFTARTLIRVLERRSGRVWIGSLVAALRTADSAATGPNRIDVAGLDHERRALSARASGRLDERGQGALRAIDQHLDDLLLGLLEGELSAEGTHLVRATVERYLPDTLEPFLAMGSAAGQVRGHTVLEEVADQLTTIEAGLAGLARRPRRRAAEEQLLQQGEFLRARFGSAPAPSDLRGDPGTTAAP